MDGREWTLYQVLPLTQQMHGCQWILQNMLPLIAQLLMMCIAIYPASDAAVHGSAVSAASVGLVDFGEDTLLCQDRVTLHLPRPVI